MDGDFGGEDDNLTDIVAISFSRFTPKKKTINYYSLLCRALYPNNTFNLLWSIQLFLLFPVWSSGFIGSKNKNVNFLITGHKKKLKKLKKKI